MGSETSELVAIKYVIHQAIVERITPLIARCTWAVRENFAQIQIQFRMNPLMKMELKQARFHLTLSEIQTQIHKEDPNTSYHGELKDGQLIFSLGNLIQSEQAPSDIRIILESVVPLAPSPLFFTFTSDSLLHENQISIISAENEFCNLKDTKRSTHV